tara:strand:- start:519 stop:1961 length:1443 start_codon:yes stop_codon:yes gene_type:complete
MDDIEVGANQDMIAAFYNGELRGLARASLVPEELGGGYAFLMMVYSNAADGETFNFEYYSFTDDTVYEIAETLDWEINLVAGDVVNPFSLNISTSTDIAVEFGDGWNWFSINVEGESMTLDSVLESLGSSGIYIKGQEGYSDYYEGFGWFGALEEISVEQMYKINLISGNTLSYTGAEVDPESRPIDLTNGWNWIGYIPSVSLDINVALESLGEDGIYIKGQEGYSDYYTGFGWFGAVEQLNPLEGYLLNMGSSGTLTYPSGSSLSSIHIGNHNYITDHDFDYKQYEFNGSVTSIIDIEGLTVSDNDMLIAYLDGECRGKASPLFFPLTNNYIFPLMIYSNEVIENNISYQYYNSTLDKYFDLESELGFENDMIIGNGIAPYRFVASTNEFIINEINVEAAYPNPFNPITKIDYSINQPTNIKISIFDIMGRLVDIIDDSYKFEGNYSLLWDASNKSSGIYYISIQSDNELKTQKVVLLK